MSPAQNSLLTGTVAATMTVAIGAGWQVVTRLGATTTLAPLDLALLRYAVPAIVLAPLLWRHGLFPRGVPALTIALMLLGAGLPFGLFSMAGAQFAPAAHMGALIPGTMPLFVALLSAIILKERFTPDRILGFVAIGSGVALIAGPAALAAGKTSDLVWLGDLFFLAASAIWAIYTVAYRRSGLSPWHASAILCFWSFLMVAPLWFLFGEQRLLTAPMQDVALQVLWQGLLAGMAGLATYAIAVRHLGASRAAMSGAFVPICSALGGVFFLDEAIAIEAALGIAATMIGVVLASGALAPLWLRYSSSET